MEGIEARMMQLREGDLNAAATLRAEDLEEVRNLQERVRKLEDSKYRTVGICTAVTFVVTTLVMLTGPVLNFG